MLHGRVSEKVQLPSICRNFLAAQKGNFRGAIPECSSFSLALVHRTKHKSYTTQVDKNSGKSACSRFTAKLQSWLNQTWHLRKRATVNHVREKSEINQTTLALQFHSVQTLIKASLRNTFINSYISSRLSDTYSLQVIATFQTDSAK